MNRSLSQTLIQALARIYPMAKRWLHSFHGGVFPKHHKSLSLKHPIKETIIPERLVLPLRQPIGQKAELLVKVGSYVKKNQLLARAEKTKHNKPGLVVPIHAPTSGNIEAIELHTLPHASGLEDLSIVIKPDFKDTAIDNALNVSGKVPINPQQVKAILLNAGIIGMGGAGFPTYAKLPSVPGQINTLIINGAECEPFITCDDLLMQTAADEIIQGAIMIANALGADNIVCGIESNKPDAIKIMKKAAEGTIATIKVVETVYPMGGEKQLIKELTGIEILQKTHAVDSGLLMFNVATYAAIFRAITLGEPLTSRLVTVSGFGLKTPFNTRALIGTPFETLANAAQPKQPINYPLVMGGPMMGFKVQNNQVPVIKTTNCILVNPPEDPAEEMPCIRCGECMDACPMHLLPQQMFWHSQAHEFEKVEKLNVFDCIECGCCSYVCPSNIPLVQYYRHAKSEIKALHAEQQATELAKQRHEFKLARIEREKQEREARLKAKKEAVKKQASKTSEPAASDNSAPAKKPSAAARAAAAKRAAKAAQSKETNTAAGDSTNSNSNIPAARRKAIEMAQKSAAAKTGSKREATKDPRVSAKQAAAKAAKAAAKKRTQSQDETEKSVNETTELTTPETVLDPKQAAKQAAMAAAKRRAQAKKEAATASQTTEPTESAKSTDKVEQKPTKPTSDHQSEVKSEHRSESNQDSESAADPREAAKQAALAAARRRAQAKKQAVSEPTAPAEARQSTTEKSTDSDQKSAPQSDDKRQKAIEAARKRAAERKAQQSEKA